MGEMRALCGDYLPFSSFPKFGREAEGGVELEHGSNGQYHFPLSAPKGEQAKGGDEQQTG